jgi:hypothetical protein
MQIETNQYDIKLAKIFSEIDKKAIEMCYELREDIMYVRDIFKKYGVNRKNCRPKDTLRQLAYPKMPTAQECKMFEEAEKRIQSVVIDGNLPIQLKNSLAANINMLYFDRSVNFFNLNRTHLTQNDILVSWQESL